MISNLLSDTVAERAVALGFVPDGQAGAVAAGSQLAAVARGALEDHLVVRELTHRVAEVSKRIASASCVSRAVSGRVAPTRRCSSRCLDASEAPFALLRTDRAFDGALLW